MFIKRKSVYFLIFVGVFAILSLVILCCSSFATYDLVILEDMSSINSSSAYLDMTAVVTTEGNCFIRGYPVSETSPYGVSNVTQYNNQYSGLNLEKANRFVQIYSGGDAVSVELSKNGGSIITSGNKLYLFSDDENFKTPTYFCENICEAKLLGDKVYVLTTEGVWGYYSVSSSQSFTPLINDVAKFIITDLDESIWILTTSNELWVYQSEDNYKEAAYCAVGVNDFDVLCTENSPARSASRYSLGYVCNGDAFYYNNYGIPTELSYETIDTNVLGINVYSKGAIVIKHGGQALLYGDDLLGDTSFNGEVLAENVVNISSSLSCVNLALENDDMISCGSMPSSEFVYFQEIIDKEK